MPLGTTPRNADVYTVGSPSKYITITPFTFSSSCGAIVYSVTTIPSTTSSIFSIDSATGAVTVFTNSPSDAATYSVTVTGILYKSGTSTIYSQNSISYDVNVLDPCFSTVITT